MNRPRIRALRRLIAFLVLRFSVRRWAARKLLPYRIQFIRWAREQNPEPTRHERRQVIAGLRRL